MTEVADSVLTNPQRGRGLSVIAGAAILESARRARRTEVEAGEEKIFRLANGASNDIELPVWAVMQSGSLAAVFVVSGGLARCGRVPDAAGAFVAGVGVWAGVKLVKPLVGRGRPESLLDFVSMRGQRQTGLGYPSGHSAVAMTLALAATRAAHPVVQTTAVAVAAATGVARMYVGAHLPLDVAGGLGIGVLCGRAAQAFARRSGIGG
jgi:membrane-associated phospholipid phosphatase